MPYNTRKKGIKILPLPLCSNVALIAPHQTTKALKGSVQFYRKRKTLSLFDTVQFALKNQSEKPSPKMKTVSENEKILVKYEHGEKSVTVFAP